MSSDTGGPSDGDGEASKASSDLAKMEALLEQLRNKHNSLRSSQSDSWNEFAKQIRMASLDLTKQFRDPVVIHESLEKLQSVMVTSGLNQVLERLNSACQKLGLKYSEQGSMVYISTDLFYIDLQCDKSGQGQVRDVRVAHHGSQPTSVPAMTQALRSGNVQLFMDHIKGFMDMYNVDSESSVKTKFFIVQQSLETDIEKINKVQLSQLKSSNLGAHIYKLWLGLVQPRNGGLPTKLTFWITPYDFLNEKDQTSHPITIDSIKNLDLGVSATIGIEQRSTSHQLQTIPLMNYTRTADNRLGTQFVATTNINSVLMPAAFILKFKKPIALSQSVIKQIERLQGACTFSEGLTYMPMLDAIVKSSGATIPSGTNRFTVALPGQVQTYYINELKTNEEPTMGALVSKLPFTHPTFIITTIALLRQQLMLNTMILSCVRSTQRVKRETKPVNMELKVCSTRLLTVTFKHPFSDSVATVDIDISDVSLPKCSIYCSGSEICSNSLASKAIQRCFSIPITMRTILKQAGHQEENLPPPTKKVKTDHGEIMQKLTDHYTSRGHYVPYGSVNTASTSCTKNIQTNKYPLCMRRFSGYKRSCFSTLSPRNSLTSTSPTKPLQSIFEGATVVNIKSIPHQAADKSLISSAPVLSRLLDDQSLVDGKNPKISQPGHPLVLEPTQGETQQQSEAPLLVELLEDPEGANAEKRLKKIQARQKRRTTSETSTSPGSAGSTPTTAAAAARKRKKSDNEEIVRELTSKVKLEVNEQQQQSQYTISSHSQLPGNMSPVVRLKADLPSSIINSGGQSVAGRPTLSKQGSLGSSSHDSALVQLLTDTSTDRKPTIKTEVKTVADLFDSPTQMKQEALQAETKVTVTSGKVGRPRKSIDEKRVKHSASADGSSKPKKMKKTESSDSLKIKESKSMDAGSFLSKSVGDKTKIKVQVKGEAVPYLSMKTLEDRASPKDKMRKPASDKEKKKKTPKSPGAGEPGSKGSTKPAAQDLMKLGFYGANNLKSLPKIPKRKPGDNQPSPTSETPPPIPQKSPVPTEWQKSSPVPNRSVPSKSSSEDATNVSLNRNKSHSQSATADSQLKKLPLLPTPRMPPLNVEAHSQSPQPILQRKSSLNDVINRLNQPNITSYTTSNASTSRFQPHKSADSQQKGIDPSPNSPDELSVIESNPVRVPLIQSAQQEIAAPASPTPEIVTQAPKSIPLAPTPKPILVKQKNVSRPLTFSPNPSRDDGLGVGL